MDQNIDDPMDSIATHGVCGLWSLIALGIFDIENGAIYTGNFKSLGIQMIGVVALCILSVFLSLLFFKSLKSMSRLRISNIQEIIGMDINLGYIIDEDLDEDRLPVHIIKQIEHAWFNIKY